MTQWYSSWGEATAAAMDANARRAHETARSRPDGMCGICGQPRDEPTDRDPPYLHDPDPDPEHDPEHEVVVGQSWGEVAGHDSW